MAEIDCQNQSAGWICQLTGFVVAYVRLCVPILPLPPRHVASMSDKNPECPLYNPLNCKEFHNPKLCAFVRKDHACLKKKKPGSKASAQGRTAASA
jgi:hypothetical protein